jgi:hypothetical protein
VPLDDEGLQEKFRGLVEPVLGARRAVDLVKRVWAIEELDDVSPLIEATAE